MTIQEIARQSDFCIQATRKGEPGANISPLVLDTCFAPAAGMTFNYLGQAWDSHTVILSDDYVGIAPERRILPTTRDRYPWLTGDDFLQPVCVKVGYTLDSKCFFEGNLLVDKAADDASSSFLLPLKPKFFEYFSPEDLRRNTDDGRPIFEMEFCLDDDQPTLVAVLRVPVAKTDEYGRHAYITFTRVYTPSEGVVLYDPDNNEGTLLTATDGVSIFPFVKLAQLNRYNVQHIVFNAPDSDIRSSTLSFVDKGELLGSLSVQSTQRRVMGDDCFFATSYHQVLTSFDAIAFDFTVKSNGQHFGAMLMPVWPEQQYKGGDDYTFAVDFGTTNTHIECLVDGRNVPLSVNSDAKKKFVANSYTLDSTGPLADLYSGARDQEFLPCELGATYRFPQRTVLSQYNYFDDSHLRNLLTLGDVNIPFIYEKEPLFFSKIVANLKWSNDNLMSQRIEAFLTELALIMRAKVLLENGNLPKTRIVWFYPLSMDTRSKSQMSYIWKRIMKEIFGVNINPDDEHDRGAHNNLIEMPESVAPYYYHRDGSDFRASTKPSVSIDIGGGTSDIVVYVPSVGAQRLPNIITSFRFAANTVFGDAYLSRQAEHNPMIAKYVKHFRDIYDRDNRDDDDHVTDPVLEDIVASKRSDDISAFLFAIGDKEQNRGKKEYSFNDLLARDTDRKIIFVYFYASIVYYIAHLLMHKQIALPRHFFFSGTGSKILDILAQRPQVNELTRDILEQVYGTTFDQAGYDFTILTSDEPKQITCRGALRLLLHDYGLHELDGVNDALSESTGFGRKADKVDLKYRYTMTDRERITYGNLQGPDSGALEKEVIGAVKQFNATFLSLAQSKNWAQKFGMSAKSIDIFSQHVNDELDEYYFRFIERFLTKNVNPQQEYEDIPFFYPIAGAIRFNLIRHIE